MIKLLVVLWLMTTAGGVAALYRSSSEGNTAHAIQTELRAAEAAEKAEDWPAARSRYSEALRLCPADDTDLELRLRLQGAIAQIRGDELPAARTVLKVLLAEAEQLAGDRGIVRDVRSTLAKASFDVGWQLRLEGAHFDLWQEPAYTARQQYQLLADEEMLAGGERTVDYQMNLERASRLCRIDPAVLAGMPFPSNCWSTSNCEKKVQRERRKRKRRKNDDAREGINDENASKKAKGW